MSPDDLADRPVCRLVTVGRRSGRVHDIEMWFGVVDGSFVFISGNGPDADWYRNALAAGEATVRIGRHGFVGAARTADTSERRRVGEVMTAKYGGWGGDPSIGLTESDWTWRVPALVVGDLRPLDQAGR